MGRVCQWNISQCACQGHDDRWSLRADSVTDNGKSHVLPPARSDADLCLTPACVHASSEILYSLSPDYENIDPCTDFEELVCGGWKEHHDLRPDQGDAFTGTIMHE